jgi:hypothetical protein
MLSPYCSKCTCNRSCHHATNNSLHKTSVALQCHWHTHLFCTRLDSSPVLTVAGSSLRCPPVSSCIMLERCSPLLLLPAPPAAAAWLLLVMPDEVPAAPFGSCCRPSSLNQDPFLRIPAATTAAHGYSVLQHIWCSSLQQQPFLRTPVPAKEQEHGCYIDHIHRSPYMYVGLDESILSAGPDPVSAPCFLRGTTPGSSRSPAANISPMRMPAARASPSLRMS